LDKKQNTLILPVCTGDIKKVGSFDSWKQCETPVMPTMIQSQNRFLVQSSSFFEFKSPLMFLELAAKDKSGSTLSFSLHQNQMRCSAMVEMSQ